MSTMDQCFKLMWIRVSLNPHWPVAEPQKKKRPGIFAHANILQERAELSATPHVASRQEVDSSDPVVVTGHQDSYVRFWTLHVNSSSSNLLQKLAFFETA